MFTRNALRLLLVASCILVCGCKPSKPTVAALKLTPTVEDKERMPASEAQCRAFAERFIEAVRTLDRETIQILFYSDAMIERALQGISLTPEQRQSLVSRYNPANSSFLIDRILGGAENGGRYKLLKIHEVDGRRRCLFRLVKADATATYQDVVLSSHSDGRVSVEDVYLFATGELMSESFRRIFLPLIAELNQSANGELSGSDKIYSNNAQNVERMNRAIVVGANHEAINIYKSLPVELRQQRFLLLAYIRAANNDHKELTTALETYRRLYPNDSAVDFLSIGYFLLTNKYDEALRCIDKIDGAVGGDPYLQILRANVHGFAKRNKEAASALEKAIEQEPDLFEAYTSRISLSLIERNYADTLIWLKTSVEKGGLEFSDLTKTADFADFVKSPQHEEWLKWYKDRKK